MICLPTKPASNHSDIGAKAAGPRRHPARTVTNNIGAPARCDGDRQNTKERHNPVRKWPATELCRTAYFGINNH